LGGGGIGGGRRSSVIGRQLSMRLCRVREGTAHEALRWRLGRYRGRLANWARQRDAPIWSGSRLLQRDDGAEVCRDPSWLPAYDSTIETRYLSFLALTRLTSPLPQPMLVGCACVLIWKCGWFMRRGALFTASAAAQAMWLCFDVLHLIAPFPHRGAKKRESVRRGRLSPA
jgi:hypothetical protein